MAYKKMTPVAKKAVQAKVKKMAKGVIDEAKAKGVKAGFKPKSAK